MPTLNRIAVEGEQKQRTATTWRPAIQGDTQVSNHCVVWIMPLHVPGGEQIWIQIHGGWEWAKFWEHPRIATSSEHSTALNAPQQTRKCFLLQEGLSDSTSLSKSYNYCTGCALRDWKFKSHYFTIEEVKASKVVGNAAQDSDSWPNSLSLNTLKYLYPK